MLYIKLVNKISLLLYKYVTSKWEIKTSSIILKPLDKQKLKIDDEERYKIILIIIETLFP